MVKSKIAKAASASIESIELDSKMLYLRMLVYVKQQWVVFSISILALMILSATNTGFLATIKMVTDEGFVNTDTHNRIFLPLMLIGLLALRAFSGFTSTFAIFLMHTL